MVEKRHFALPPCDRAEVLRYAGVRVSDEATEAQLSRCIAQSESAIDARVCFARYPLRTEGTKLDLGFAKVESEALARNLTGCEEIVLFAATVGLGVDRLIRRAEVADMAAAVWFQAIGTERVERLCRAFCDELAAAGEAEGLHARPRFSPGYGDLPLALQREIMRALDCQRAIGVTLGESLLMSPSKSVTAIVGFGKKPCAPHSGGCGYCDKTDCPYREVT